MTSWSTIGYEGSSSEEFVSALSESGVTLLVDVRERTTGRKPGFSKTALAGRLREAGIGYEHWREFGTPKPVRDILKKRGDWAGYRREYLSLLDGKADLLVRLAERVEGESACLMCFEADAGKCHRSLVVERLRELGLLDGAEHLRVRPDRQ